MTNLNDMIGKVIEGDCLQVMKQIPDGSIDAIITDPPYGTTACKWDSVIPFEPMWEQLKRIIKPNGAIVLMASQPFTTTLISSNMEMFKYCWVWEKSRPSGFVHSKNKPLKAHEDVCVFSYGVTIHVGQSDKRMTYNPQGLIEGNFARKQNVDSRASNSSMQKRPSHQDSFVSKHTNYPRSIISFSSEQGLHPTQKPVALMAYLIKTYTNEGETVLDFAAGSGTTGVACRNTKRNFILIEKEEKYVEICRERLKQENLF